ncbi:MAG: hypothetical protein Q9159_005674 [Coniocarpon cinnabarinum]
MTAALTSASLIVTESDEGIDALLRDPRLLNGIAPLSFHSGMTIAVSRLLGYVNELPVVVYTTTYAALAGDQDLFKMWPPSANKPRNRRIVAVLCVFAGAVASTWIELRSVGMLATLWLAAGIKLVLAFTVGGLLPQWEQPGLDASEA